MKKFLVNFFIQFFLLINLKKDLWVKKLKKVFNKKNIKIIIFLEILVIFHYFPYFLGQRKYRYQNVQLVAT